MATSQKARTRASRTNPGAETSGREIRVILSTAPARAAARLARRLVDARLAACVNILPGVASIYRWKGRVEKASESLLLIKTTAARASACLTALADAHPYEVPEGLVFAPCSALAPYASWVDALCGSAHA